MKTNFVVLAAAASTSVARSAYNRLSATEQSDVQQKLAKWKTLYGSLALAHGFVPPATESLDEDAHSQDELDRFHNTILEVEEASRDNLGATFSEFNQFALLTTDEFKRMLQTSFGGAQNKTKVAAAPESVRVATASAIDWSTSKCNAPVKHQGHCGSCWAFSTLGVSETAHCLATGNLLSLSVQQLTSCDKRNHGCDGGYAPYALDTIEESGVCTEADYPYQSGTSHKNEACQTTCTKTKLKLGDVKVTNGEANLVAVLNTQPVVVAVEAGNPVWKNYKGGVVTKCPGSYTDHAVIAVGYGTSSDDYFKVKNSWGATWGENGYIYLKRGMGADADGVCQVTSLITYPEVFGSPVAPTNVPSTTIPQPSLSTKQPSIKPTPVPTTTPTPTRETTSAPSTTPSTNIPTTTAKPKKTCAPKSRKPTTSTPSPIPQPSRTHSLQPSTTTTPTQPTTKAPTPHGDCHGCAGCYSKSLGYCLPADYDKATCASYSYFQTTWCGN
ncbi:Aste57867_15666 [Aphanomyces stellatus]|uniref:Aste57867_15666 protein n=1 Tax=Aphanomyces stellatus TaxID=120398 RepID=A0A485L4N5_9STRA|nr:hypothetical protein As57867_015610 [Aphanomyces stellatus]VFT92460.1 Aste57867_15666 [Aphanomyces stellatus]